MSEYFSIYSTQGTHSVITPEGYATAEDKFGAGYFRASQATLASGTRREPTPDQLYSFYTL